MKKFNTIDLFTGCGGLLDGFLQSGHYTSIASVEWEKAPVKTLRKRLADKWGCTDTEESVIHFDMQRFEELCNGFENDPKYGSNKGLDALIGNQTIDVIVGGPPCQAYSVAGRVSDKDSMKNDYRNYLFEYYLKIVSRYKPKVFVFENVPGMLSAMPDGTPIVNLIKRDMNNNGYEVLEDLSKAVLDTSDFGVPQQRKRVIIIGVNKEYFKNYDIQEIISDFYFEILEAYKVLTKKTVYDAIGDMPGCYPMKNITVVDRRKVSHSIPECTYSWHVARFQNDRDIKIFNLLARDIETGANLYQDSNKLNELYNEATGANSKVHKYHVLRKDKPSTTILAHLYKDGLRFIHYDSEQARTITVREAARLQTFDDDFEFVGTMADAYKMIGNAVPPKFAKALANGVNDFLKKYSEV